MGVSVLNSILMGTIVVQIIFIYKNNIKGEEESCNTHYKVGKAVRGAIEEIGDIKPEDLPIPKKSIKELENNDKKKLG